MKTTTVIATIALLAAFVTAQDASATDVYIVRGALEDVVAAVTTLDTGVQAFSGPADVDSLQGQSEAVITTLNTGTSNIGPVQGLISIN